MVRLLLAEGADHMSDEFGGPRGTALALLEKQEVSTSIRDVITVRGRSATADVATGATAGLACCYSYRGSLPC